MGPKRPAKDKELEGEWIRATAEAGVVVNDRVRRFRLVVVEGPEAGREVESTADRCSIGAHPSNLLVLTDPAVSRFHCEVRVEAEGPLLRDLGSRNGTFVDGLRIRDAFLRTGSRIGLGRTRIELRARDEHNRLPMSSREELGHMWGRSSAMREVFALLERAAASDATVLLYGETGTGKGAAAEAIHGESARRESPLVVVDCGAIPPTLLESELFGHEKGSFTGAVARRIGAFEAASGGTVFLDEIGELAADLQPKLLRVLENRTVRRIGSNEHIPVDVRLIAATNRDLRLEVNAGRFRSDLYYRLAVLTVRMPALRRRPEDMEELCRRLLASVGASAEQIGGVLTLEHLRRLEHAAWPGNVRELRNYLERCLVFEDLSPASTAEPMPAPAEATLPFSEARRRALAEFERRYVGDLLRLHDGRLVKAARAAGLNRVYLYRLARRHGYRGGAEE